MKTNKYKNYKLKYIFNIVLDQTFIVFAKAKTIVVSPLTCIVT